MASIEKRTDKQGNNSYRVKIRLKGRKTETATFDRLTDAKRWATQTEAAIREGRYFQTSESKKRTLDEAIERYVRDCLPHLKDQSPRVRHLSWWRQHAGFLPLADITPALLIELRDKLRATPILSGNTTKQRTDATVNRYMASLSPVFTAAVNEWEWMQSNPCLKVKRGKEARGRDRFLSNEERERLLAACDQASDTPELKIIVLVAITTGARRGEILGLRWRDVDLKRRVLTLRGESGEGTKNGEIRSVPLVGPAYDAMKAWSKVCPIDQTAFVFPGRTRATQNKPLDFERPWQTALKRADLKDFKFHDLRHTAASYLAMNGAGLREIADILGHKTLAMVQRYSHLTQDHKAAVVERMAAAMFSERSKP